MDIVVENKSKSEPIAFTFPGHGEPCGIAPGSFMYRAHESIEGPWHGHRIPLSCDRRSCPDHYHDWGKLRAGEIIQRLNAGRDHLKDDWRTVWDPISGRFRRMPGHKILQRFIVSPPQDVPLGTAGDLDRLFKQSYEIMKIAGISGAEHVFHHARIPSRFNDRTDVEEGPHFHGVGYGFIDPELVLCVQEQTGWIIKGQGKPDNLFNHLTYVLSHAAVPYNPLNPAIERSKHCIRWWGTLYYGAFSCENASEGSFCALCNHDVPFKEWIRVAYRGKEGPPEEEFFVLNVEEWRIWESSYGVDA